MTPNADQRKAMYTSIVRSREFDDRILELYFADKMPVFDLGKALFPGRFTALTVTSPALPGP